MSKNGEKIIDLTKYHNKGMTGLINLGNTCFLNACVQVLNHTYELNELVISKRFEKNLKTDMPDSTILKEWLDLRTVMWSNNGVVSPNKFVFKVHGLAVEKNRDIFTGWAQNDMPEFLLFMVECMHNSISRGINMHITGTVEHHLDQLAVKCYGLLKDTYAREYSEIMDMFYGVHVSELRSLNGEMTHSIRPESFFMLDLPIPAGENGPVNIYDCMNHYTRFEIMDGDNSWFNEKTNQKEAVQKRLTFWNFPKILVVALKRFSPDGSAKNRDMVEFPINGLDLEPYVSGYNSKDYKYDLYGICNHIGGVTGGHYTAYVKNSMSVWSLCDDNVVKPVDSKTNIVTPAAYCLFYRKKNTPV
jgi:ubiquitin C-terminal hydrolase